MLGDRTAIAERAAADIATLCAGEDRQPGTQRNRDAADYVAEQLHSLGAVVEVLPFEVPEWTAEGAALDVAGMRYRLHPGPYSRPCSASSVLVTASTAAELETLPGARGAVLLLHGEIAAQQLTPRAYPWYENPEHAAIYDAIERLSPAAVVAVTTKNPSMTAARSPFPLIEDPAFEIPTAFCASEEGDALLAHAGEVVHIGIDSSTRPSTGTQPVGTIAGSSSGGRVILAGHLDSTWGSPGAIDNAAGVAIVLATARLLAAASPGPTLEIVCFNGEDHATSPGEVAYLGARSEGFDDVVLMVNVDGAGFIDSPAAVSLYGCDPGLEATVDDILAGFPGVERGPQWYASDHAIFAMRGVPSLAVTSRDFQALWRSVAHTAHDVPENIDCGLVAQVARALASVILTLPGHD